MAHTRKPTFKLQDTNKNLRTHTCQLKPHAINNARCPYTPTGRSVSLAKDDFLPTLIWQR